MIAAHPAGFVARDVTDVIEAAFADFVDISVEAANAWIALDAPEAVRMLGPAANGARLPQEFRIGLIDALIHAGSDAVPYLREAATDPARPIRNAALAALGEMSSATLADADDDTSALAGLVVLEALRGDLIAPPDVEDDAPDADAPADDAEPKIPVPPAAHGSTLDAILSPPEPSPPPEGAPNMPDLTAEDERHLALVEHRKLGKKRVPLDPGIPAHIEIRRYAASLLGEIVDPRMARQAALALAQVLEDPDTALINAALDSLACLAGAGADMPKNALLPTLDDRVLAGADQTRLLAIRLAGYVGDDATEARFCTVLGEKSRALRLEAVRALGHIGADAATLRLCLGDPWPQVRLTAAEILTARLGAEAADLLVGFAFSNEGYHHRDAARLLAKTAPDAGTRGFLDVLADPEQTRVWLVAIEALDEIFAHSKPGSPPVRRVA